MAAAQRFLFALRFVASRSLAMGGWSSTASAFLPVTVPRDTFAPMTDLPHVYADIHVVHHVALSPLPRVHASSQLHPLWFVPHDVTRLLFMLYLVPTHSVCVPFRLAYRHCHETLHASPPVGSLSVVV